MSDDMPLIRVTGPDLTQERVREIGAAYARLFNAVAAEMYGRSPDLQCTGVKRICDGCDRLADTYDQPPGWVTMPDGRDYCEDCARAGDREAGG